MDDDFYANQIVDFPPTELGNLPRIDPRNPQVEDEVEAFALDVETQRIMDSWEEAFKAAINPRSPDHLGHPYTGSASTTDTVGNFLVSLRDMYSPADVLNCHERLVELRTLSGELQTSFRRAHRLLRRSMCRNPAKLWSWKELVYLYLMFVLQVEKKLTDSASG